MSMERILALDISSSTIGWAILELDNQILTLPHNGYIKPPPKRKGSMSFRLSETFDHISDLIDLHKPTDVVVESYAKRFSKGRSSAQTIITLSVFNEVCSLVAYRKLGKDTYQYPVVSIRAALGKHFGQKIVSKDDIFPVIDNNCKSFIPLKNRNNNTKKESGDIADAIAVGLTHILKENKIVSSWNI
jgi:Holliday junction resolvasome RuvABC endonuclease subunit